MTDPDAAAHGDFDAIRAAVEETARGRWFLEIFATRIRAAESDRIIGAIERVQRRLQRFEPAAGAYRDASDLFDETRAALARLSPVAARAGRDEGAADPLDAAIATGAGVAEDFARGAVDPARDVEAIARTLALHAVTVQRMRIMVQALKALELRMLDSAGDAAPAQAPAPAQPVTSAPSLASEAKPPSVEASAAARPAPSSPRAAAVHATDSRAESHPLSPPVAPVYASPLASSSLATSLAIPPLPPPAPRRLAEMPTRERLALFA